MQARVLCVDDDPLVLSALQRSVDDRFHVVTANGPTAALAMLDRDGPFSVVMSDLRMPSMDGGALLEQVKRIAPDAVRLLLTGTSEVNDAAVAINRGGVFRMLCKPCMPAELNAALEAAVAHHQVARAERDLLERTLSGTVRMLGEVLSVAAPRAFERAQFLRGCVVHMCAELGVQDAWSYVAAATLAHLGCVGLPADLLEKVYANKPLDPAENVMYETFPETSYRLLARIPRLETVAEIVRRQRRDIEPMPSEDVELGVKMLRAALFVDTRVSKGDTVIQAVGHLAKMEGMDRRLIESMGRFVDYAGDSVVRDLRVHEIAADMMLEEDVKAKNGMLIIGKGKVVNETVLAYLARFAEGVGIVEPVKVRITSVVARRLGKL